MPGVWRVAAVPPCWEQRPLGAVLWGGPVTVASRLTSAQVQELLPGRIDFLHPEQNLVIEVDGRRWHAARREKKRDKRHDNELNISGRRVLRVTWEDLRFEEAYTLDLVARALGLQRLF